MPDIKQRELKMQEKRKNTPFREFIKTIASRRALGFYKNSWMTTIFPDTGRVWGVVSHKQFEEGRDALTASGLEYDASKSFFENIKVLMQGVHFPATILFGECENANFTDQTLSIRNWYLSYVVIRDCENILYSLSIKEHSINVLNSFMVWDNCENIYFSKWIIKSYNIFYSKHILNSSNIRFSDNLTGCSECIFCNNLDNQSYCIENKVYAKEDYLQKKQELLRQKDQFLWRYLKLSNLWNNIASHDVTGTYNINCANIQDGYYNAQINEGRNVILVWGKEPAERVYDCFTNTPAETDVYGSFSVGYCQNVYNSHRVSPGSNIYYCLFLENCSYCLGCIGLKNREFCILNKEYPKEERFALANKIFEKMETDGILWDAFPAELNPFYFNDTAAYLIDDSFTKEEVMKEWFLWRDDAITTDIPEGSEVLSVKDLSKFQMFAPSGAREINPEILKKVIKDEKGNCYRIVKMEYDFLMKPWLPLPELHWLDRIKLGFKFK